MPYVAVAVPFHADNWYFDVLADAVRDRLESRNVHAERFVHQVGRDADAALTDRIEALFADAGCIGAIAIGYAFTPEQVARLTAGGRPIVTVGGACSGVSSVALDDRGAARAATEHLIALGHSSIAHLGCYTFSSDDFSMRSDRVLGYREAMLSAGLDEFAHVVACEFVPGSAARATRELLTDPEPPTALFVTADSLAFEALAVAKELGVQVPRDLSIVAIDDHPDSPAHELTTMRQDLAAMGAAAADLACDGGPPRDLVFETGLVVRRTTAPPGVGGKASGRSLLGRLLRRR